MRLNTDRAVAEPPSYITRTLGIRPASPAQDRAWVSAVVAIEQYRVEHDITDRRTAVGPEPANHGQALDWYGVNEIVLDARDFISRPKRNVQRMVLTIEAPSVEIDI